MANLEARHNNRSLGFSQSFKSYIYRQVGRGNKNYDDCSRGRREYNGVEIGPRVEMEEVRVDNMVDKVLCRVMIEVMINIIQIMIWGIIEDGMAAKIKKEILSEETDQVIGRVQVGLLSEGKQIIR